MPGRHASSESYRYGFQGQEKDDVDNTSDALYKIQDLYNEVDGEGNLDGAKFLERMESEAKSDFRTIKVESKKASIIEIKPIKKEVKTYDIQN